MKVLKSILERQGFNPNFGDHLLQSIKKESVDYKYYFKLLAICKQYYLPILKNHSEIIEEMYSLFNSNSTNSLLILMMLHIFNNSKISDDHMQNHFKNYIINYPKLDMFLGLKHLSKLTINYKNKWFNILKKWFDLVRESNENIYCDSCDSLMVPVFRKSDSFICSNPSCENVSVIYHNHCWSCGSEIDSKYDSLCSNCGWYICSECNQCRPQKFGGCNNQNSTGTIAKYKPYSSLSEISKYIDGIFLNNIIKFNKLENTLINSDNYIINNCNRGKKILSSEEELTRYFALYLPHHTIKLDSALSDIDFKSISKHQITVWDWGCGQAVGSLVFCEHMNRLEIDLQIDRIVLIEPSVISINAGKTLLKFYIQENGKSSPIIDLITKEFDQLNNEDFNNDSKVINFHILSNILDITTFDLDRFIHFLITNFYSGSNYFICTGPKYSKSIERIDKFFDGISKQLNTTLIKQDSTSIKAGVYNSKKKQILKKNITRYEKVFKTVK